MAIRVDYILFLLSFFFNVSTPPTLSQELLSLSTESHFSSFTGAKKEQE